MKTTQTIEYKTNTKLYELIDYYEVCNRCENKSPRTVSWYTVCKLSMNRIVLAPFACKELQSLYNVGYVFSHL